MNCDPKSLLQIASCFRCLPKPELTASIIYVLCRWANAGTGRQYVENWVQEIINNGGEEPSQNTKDVLETFVDGLSSEGLLDKMLAVNCIVPDSLASACAPIIHVKGLSYWTNVGHIDSELTVNGLSGINSDPPHNLDTGFSCLNDLPNSNSFGMTLYSTDTVNNTRSDAAVVDNVLVLDAQLLTNYSGDVYFDCFDAVNGRVTAPTMAGGLGYFSGNRVSATESYIYGATGSTAHHQMAGPGGDITGTSRPSCPMPLGCWNICPALYQQGTSKRFSFFAIHYGLTEAESSKLFTLVHSMRQGLGGGFTP